MTSTQGRRSVLIWNGDLVEASEREGAAQGLHRASDHLLEAARALIPVLSGYLTGTGKADVDEEALLAVVSFDGPYAVIQHEALDWQHPRGGQAKYLEIPKISERPEMAELLAAAIRKALAG